MRPRIALEVGQVIGVFTVTSTLRERTKGGPRGIFVRCPECREVKLMRLENVRSSRSCGCLPARKPDTPESIAARASKLKKPAKPKAPVSAPSLDDIDVTRFAQLVSEAGRAFGMDVGYAVGMAEEANELAAGRGKGALK